MENIPPILHFTKFTSSNFVDAVMKSTCDKMQDLSGPENGHH